jgi:hypothetical protein
VTGRYSLNFPEPRQRDGWFRVGNLDVTTTALMVLMGVVSMFVYAASKTWFLKLVFHPIWVRDGDIWRLITWPIANPPDSIFVIITLIFFWFFGHRIEEMVGRVRFTWLMVISTVLPAAVVTLIGRFQYSTSLEVGLGVLGTAMLVVFALDAPNAPFFFNIPAWIVAWSSSASTCCSTWVTASGARSCSSCSSSPRPSSWCASTASSTTWRSSRGCSAAPAPPAARPAVAGDRANGSGTARAATSTAS